MFLFFRGCLTVLTRRPGMFKFFYFSVEGLGHLGCFNVYLKVYRKRVPVFFLTLFSSEGAWWAGVPWHTAEKPYLIKSYSFWAVKLTKMNIF